MNRYYYVPIESIRQLSISQDQRSPNDRTFLVFFYRSKYFYPVRGPPASVRLGKIKSNGGNKVKKLGLKGEHRKIFEPTLGFKKKYALMYIEPVFPRLFQNEKVWR